MKAQYFSMRGKKACYPADNALLGDNNGTITGFNFDNTAHDQTDTVVVSPTDLFTARVSRS